MLLCLGLKYKFLIFYNKWRRSFMFNKGRRVWTKVLKFSYLVMLYLLTLISACFSVFGILSTYAGGEWRVCLVKEMVLSRTHLCCIFLINMCLVFVCMFCHKFPKGEIVNVIFCKLVTKGYYGHFTCNMFWVLVKLLGWVLEVPVKVCKIKVSSFFENGW